MIERGYGTLCIKDMEASSENSLFNYMPMLLVNTAGKPSDPGAFVGHIWLKASTTSSAVKGFSSCSFISLETLGVIPFRAAAICS